VTEDSPRGSPLPTKLRWVGYLLAVSYALGAPAAAVLEYRGAVPSERFSYPASFIYLTCAIQLVSAGGVLVRRFAPAAAAALSVTTLGAVLSHFRIGSPLAAVPAVTFTIVQAWFGVAVHRLPEGPRRQTYDSVVKL
jgi:hypothetical protein